MDRMHWLWIERVGRDMTKQRLRIQVENIQKKKFLSDVEICDYGDLEVATKEEQNCTDVA